MNGIVSYTHKDHQSKWFEAGVKAPLIYNIYVFQDDHKLWPNNWGCYLIHHAH